MGESTFGPNDPNCKRVVFLVLWMGGMSQCIAPLLSFTKQRTKGQPLVLICDVLHVLSSFLKVPLKTFLSLLSNSFPAEIILARAIRRTGTSSEGWGSFLYIAIMLHTNKSMHDNHSSPSFIVVRLLKHV